MNKYEGHQIAFAIFGLVAVLLIGVAMFAGPPEARSFIFAKNPAGDMSLRSPDYKRTKFVILFKRSMSAGAICTFDGDAVGGRTFNCYWGEAK